MPGNSTKTFLITLYQCCCKLMMSATMRNLFFFFFFFPLHSQILQKYYGLAWDCKRLCHFKQQAMSINNDVIQPKDVLALFSKDELESLKQIDWSLICSKILRNVNISTVLKAEDVLGEFLAQNQVICHELRSYHTVIERKLMILMCKQLTSLTS